MSGYSGTPLARKLGVRPGQRLWADGMPAHVAEELASAEPGLDFLARPEPLLDYAHIFIRVRADMIEKLAMVRPLLAQNGMLWVSWPKKASGIDTDVNENIVRERALPLGFVDTKVCAVDEIWSGLKLVIRKELRMR